MTMTMTAKERTLVSENTIFEQLEWRYATKGFDPERKISEKDWVVIRDAAILFHGDDQEDHGRRWVA